MMSWPCRPAAALRAREQKPVAERARGGGLVHGPVGALPHDLCGGAQQAVGRELQRPIKVHQLATNIPAGLHLRNARPWLLAAPGNGGTSASTGLLGRRGIG